MNESNKLVDLWIQHNSFFWQQVRALPFVEAVILAGAYKLFVDNQQALASAVLFFGTILLLLLFLMLRRHAQHARKFRESAGEAIPSPEPPWLGWRSDSIAISIPALLAIFNIALFIMVICKYT